MHLAALSVKVRLRMNTMLARRLGMGLIWMSGLGLVGFVLWAWRSALDPINPPAASSFPPSTIRRGAELAALGACATCHTGQGGATFAGGLPISTPFGTVYSTNITPDPTTGIGRWSQAAFQRAMRDGVDREGRHLYPAFPYDHFTLVSDADDAALYAYLMTREPVTARPPDNHLPFPLNLRFLLAGWKLVFFRAGPYRPDARHDEQWNRGAYLASGLGHCGACHTPRNSFGAEISGRGFDGGTAAGWYAYAINSNSESRVRWNAESLHAFLRNGWHAQHGNAQGPMADVVRDLSSVPDPDILALATYTAWTMRAAARGQQADSAASGDAETRNNIESNAVGAAIYAGACADCHDGARALPYGGIKLPLSTAVTAKSATNLINLVLDGLHPPAGSAGAIMPGFASALTDGQLESLLAFIRSNFGAMPPWTGVESSVREARSRDRD